MTRYSHLLKTRNRFANGDLWRGRACVRGYGGGRGAGSVLHDSSGNENKG
ncbi:MAG: hypothetical protein C5S48_01100 [Candidatus Methanogaster sp.]|nr:MAG: hypothetical protein C5S48_01100 [ANME-2 cluster archaeon]